MSVVRSIRSLVRRRVATITASLAVMAVGAVAHAGQLDLTAKDSSGFINSGFFQQGEVNATGTGSVHSFVRIQSTGKAAMEMGYNSDFRPVQFDEKNDAPHNHSLLLSDVPVV